jgi:5-hydroxyisourate hydrolase
VTLSTHVLDTALGRPAAGVPVTLARREDGTWHDLADGVTDADGRWRAPDDVALVAGADHRLTFATAAHLAAAGREPFFPEAAVVFRPSEPGRHHHVPLLLSPYSYSTYLGS